jgi:transcriptional regulator with XRE-family HTH domain
MGSKVREIREARGLRREDVASRAGVSYEYVRKLESEEPPVPGLAIARRIADVLSATVDDLWPTKASDPLVGLDSPDAA